MSKIIKLKKRINTKLYYQGEGIELGMHTGQGWYQTRSLCPFHDDKRAGTLYVNVHTGKFNCYSCGSHGDVIDFHVKRHNFTLKEALKSLGGQF